MVDWLVWFDVVAVVVWVVLYLVQPEPFKLVGGVVWLVVLGVHVWIYWWRKAEVVE